MRLERHPAVVAEDLPGYTSIARDNPTAERVLDAVEKTFGQLTQQPDCGVFYPTRNRNLSSVRMLPIVKFTDYRVFYRIDLETVRVLYLVHSARYLPRLFRSEPRT